MCRCVIAKLDWSPLERQQSELAWAVAEQISARTGEDRLGVLDRLIPDAPHTLPLPRTTRA
jgi:hypothetical protein